jgi:hypothetical protein
MTLRVPPRRSAPPIYTHNARRTRRAARHPISTGSSGKLQEAAFIRPARHSRRRANLTPTNEPDTHFHPPFPPTRAFPRLISLPLVPVGGLGGGGGVATSPPADRSIPHRVAKILADPAPPRPPLCYPRKLHLIRGNCQLSSPD